MRVGDKIRKAVSAIYFPLPAGEVSKFHRVNWDEVWNVYEGEVELVWVDDGNLDREHLGKAGRGSKPFVIVPGGSWQAAWPVGDYALVGCTVAPGFEWEDFELLRDAEEGEKRRIMSVMERFPELRRLL